MMGTFAHRGVPGLGFKHRLVEAGRQRVDHVNPMRYSGGLLGGSWLTALTSDLGHGKVIPPQGVDVNMTDQHTPPNQEPPFDVKKWAFEVNRQHAQRAHDRLDEFHRYINEAAMKSGELALRMGLLINGGAAIALLTFIGSLPKEQKRAFAETLVWFASGVALAVAAIALSYFTNYFMAGIASSRLRTWEHPYIQEGPTTPRYRRLNIAFHIAAVVVGLASLAAMLRVRDALTHLA
jgi:hypothetical protein